MKTFLTYIKNEKIFDIFVKYYEYVFIIDIGVRNVRKISG